MLLHRNWTGRFSRERQRRASAHGKAMAARRWERDRERRKALARLTAEQYPNRIVRRVVVIDNERMVREAVIFAWDSERDAKRKLKGVLRV